jgi:Tfp pilus assembly protein PilX
MRNRGIALVAGLVLLAAISLLALSAASGTTLQRNMAINQEESARALRNASIAASFALAWLNSRADVERESGCLTRCVLPVGIGNAGSVPDQVEFETNAWWQSHGVAAGIHPETGEADFSPAAGAEPARWLIEEVHYKLTGDRKGSDSAEGVGYYRVLSRGSGRDARSVAVIEAIAARPWDSGFQPGIYPPNGPASGYCGQVAERYDCGRLSWRRLR